MGYYTGVRQPYSISGSLSGSVSYGSDTSADEYGGYQNVTGTHLVATIMAVEFETGNDCSAATYGGAGGSPSSGTRDGDPYFQLVATGCPTVVCKTWGDVTHAGGVVDTDISTTFGLSFTATEVLDYVVTGVPDASTPAYQNGVFDSPFAAQITYSLVVRAGDPITVTMSGGGKSTTGTIIYDADFPVSYDPRFQLVGYANGQVYPASRDSSTGTYTKGADPHRTHTASASMSFNGLPVVGLDTVSTTNGFGGTATGSNVGGASFSISEYMVYQPYFGGMQGGFANVTATVSPVKAFGLDISCFAVGDPYPGGPVISCSRYLGDTAGPYTGPDVSLGYSQRQAGSNAQVGYGDASTHVTQNHSVSEWQPLNPTVGGDWCKANGEVVTYQNSDGVNEATFYVPNGNVYIAGPSAGNVTLSQAASWPVSAASSATATTSGNTVTYNFSPAFDFSGFRYLTLHGCSCAPTGTGTAAPQPARVSLGGKTFTVTVPNSAGSVVVDLLAPDGAAAGSDATDDSWPDPNPALAYDGEDDPPAAVEGVYSGVRYAPSLSLSGTASGYAYTFGAVTQDRQTETIAHFLPTWGPRFDQDMTQAGPTVHFGTDMAGTTVPKIRRGLVVDTDGRASLEFGDFQLNFTTTPSGVTSYNPVQFSLAQMAASCTGKGLTCTTTALAPDGSQNLSGGLLSSGSPATFACFGGAGSQVGLTLPATVAAPLLCTAFEWYPGCPAASGLTAKWIGRAQARGVLLTTGERPAPGGSATLYPGAGEVQPSGAAVGSGTADSPQGYYRTTGAGLDGYQLVEFDYTTTPDDGSAGTVETEYRADPSAGTVQASIGTGGPRSVSQSFRSRRISRVALAVPPVMPIPTGRPGVANLAREDGPYHLLSPLYDMSGNVTGIGHWRSDTGRPNVWDAAAVPVVTDAGAKFPHLTLRKDGQRTLIASFFADGSGGLAAGSYRCLSYSDGDNWTSPVSV